MFLFDIVELFFFFFRYFSKFEFEQMGNNVKSNILAMHYSSGSEFKAGLFHFKIIF